MSAWAADYQAALREYLWGTGESGLNRAYELGRKAIEENLSILDMTAIQQELARELLEELPAGQAGRQLDRIKEFFIESLSPYEMTQRAYQEANAKLLRWKHVFEHAGWGIVITSPDGQRVEAANPAFARMHGYAAEEILGRPLTDTVAPEDRSDLAARIRNLGAEGHLAFESTQLRKDGSRFTGAVDVTAVSGEQEVLYLAINVQDITERKRFESALEKAKNEAEGANRELEAFSYSVAHDLRAPLRTLNGYSQMLLEDHAGGLDSEGKRKLKVVSEGAKRMGILIDDLLEFSRMGRAILDPSAFDMTELAREVMQELVSGCAGRKIEFHLGDLGRAWGDRALIRQVFTNLLANAIKYTGRREFAVIEVGSSPGPKEDAYWVKDNGAGFDMAYSKKLFGVFQRLHSQKEFEGTGVGLALVQRIVQRHGGRVWAQSAVNGGATFTFTLPRGVGHERG